jgi:alpha-mannosidase
LGDFHFAHNQSEIHLERAMLLGWVTNNYWETNFPGMQPGVVTARYTIQFYEGDFNEARAHKLAAESEHARPLAQHLGEPAVPSMLPTVGTLLHLPQPPILNMGLRATSKGGVLLTLFNASDSPQTGALSSALIEIQSAQRCDLFGNPLETLKVNDGVVEITFLPRQTFTVELS